MSGDILLSAMWVSVSVMCNTVLGWSMGAAGPVLAMFLALGTGYAIFKVCFDDDWHEHDGDEADYDESGATDEARDFWRGQDGVDR